MPKKLTKITTSELILSAIFYLQQKNGVTAKEITKYICEKRGCPQKHMKENVKKALERATDKGIFCRKRGIYRINNDFGLNKILNNKGKGKGKRGNKVVKSKENAHEGRADLEHNIEVEKPMLLYDIIDERMNDVYDNSGFYVELPSTGDQDDDDDEDFDETDDDDDDDDFFSDDMESEPKPLVSNIISNNRQGMAFSGSMSLSDPFQKKDKRDEFLEKKLSEMMAEEREDEEKEQEALKGGIPETRSLQLREKSIEPSDNSLETVQSNDENQSRDEDHHTEEYNDQNQIEMDWDCQANDLENMDHLLQSESYIKNTDQRRQVVSDPPWNNANDMKLQENTSRIKTEIDPMDSMIASQMAESTR